MASILEKLYYGEISPCSDPTPTTEKYMSARKEAERLAGDIARKHSDCKQLLEQYEDELHVAAAIESLQDFKRGFSIGARFILEIFNGLD